MCEFDSHPRLQQIPSIYAVFLRPRSWCAVGVPGLEAPGRVVFRFEVFRKWHLGETEGRLPNDQGFDEWWGYKNSVDEAGWTSYATFDALAKGCMGQQIDDQVTEEGNGPEQHRQF